MTLKYQFILCAIILKSTVVESNDCIQCNEKDCFTADKCNNAKYCFIAKYGLHMSSYTYGKKDREIKGCLSGSLLKDNIEDHCELHEDEQGEVTNCFCKNKKPKASCNRNTVSPNYKREPVKLVTCIECSGEECQTLNKCKAEACYYSRVFNHKGEVESWNRGCIKAAIPIIERSAAMSCSQPPMAIGSIHEIQQDKIINTESCLCSTDFCNLKPDLGMNAKEKECPLIIDGAFSQFGFHLKHGGTTCKGEYCYDIDMNDTHKETSMNHLRLKGCMTYSKKKTSRPSELHDRGCLQVKSLNLSVKMCIETDKPETIEEAEEEEEEEEEEVMQKDEGTKLETKEEEKSEKKEEKPPAQKPNVVDDGEKGDKGGKVGPETKSAGGKPEGGASGKVTYVGKSEHDAVYTPGAGDGANTTLVAIFVVIMVIIVIAGVVWKFELHRKIFRARYDTVAG